VLDGGDDGRADAHVRVEDVLPRVRQGEHQPLDQLDRKLAGMNGFLDMIVLDVRENPHIPGVLAERIARKLAGFRTLEVFLAGIFRRYPDRVEVEQVIVSLGKPKYRLVATGQPFRAMQAVFEMPDDPVPQLQPMALEQGVENGVEREYFSILNMVSDLPAQRASGMQQARALGDDPRLLTNISFEGRFRFVSLADVVRWRGHDQLHRGTAQRGHEFEVVPTFHHRVRRGEPVALYRTRHLIPQEVCYPGRSVHRQVSRVKSHVHVSFPTRRNILITSAR
jgi:hypothetical protein